MGLFKARENVDQSVISDQLQEDIRKLQEEIKSLKLSINREAFLRKQSDSRLEGMFKTFKK